MLGHRCVRKGLGSGLRPSLGLGIEVKIATIRGSEDRDGITMLFDWFTKGSIYVSRESCIMYEE